MKQNFSGAKSFLNNNAMKKLTLTLFALLLLCSFKLGDSSQSVYICSDSSAKVYHSSYTCRGMESCKGDVMGVSLEKAEKMGKKKCKICF